MIEVDFADKEFHAKISMEDPFNYSLAAMNNSGLVLASKAISSSQEYDNEEDFEKFQFDADAYEFSHVKFTSFLGDKQSWVVKLPKDENVNNHQERSDWLIIDWWAQVETVAVGDGWCSV